LISVLKNLTIEDRIVLHRLVVGIIFGAAVFAASFFVPPLTLSPLAWSTSVLVYYVTVVHIVVKYKPTSRFQTYLRGLATFYGAWLLTAIVLYEVAGHLGVRR